MSNDRFVGTTLILGFFLTTATLGAHYDCIAGLSYDCVYENVTIATESDENTLTLGKQLTEFELRYPNITYLSPAIMDSTGFKLLTHLFVAAGNVRKIYLKSTLEDLEAYRNNLETVVIPASDNMNIKRLSITHNLLREIPTNIGYCKNLTILTIRHNRIQSLDLFVLSGLEKLKTLNLGFNQIHSVEATAAIKLPSLESLDLENNGMSKLAMHNWELPRLDILYLNQNELKSTDNIAALYPSLNTLVLINNKWTCEWINATLDSLTQNNKTIDLLVDVDCF